MERSFTSQFNFGFPKKMRAPGILVIFAVLHNRIFVETIPVEKWFQLEGGNQTVFIEREYKVNF